MSNPASSVLSYFQADMSYAISLGTCYISNIPPLSICIPSVPPPLPPSCVKYLTCIIFFWYISHFHCAYHFPSNVFYVTPTSNVPDIFIFPISICIYTILNITASDGYGGHTSVSNVSTISAILGIYPSATLVSLS